MNIWDEVIDNLDAESYQILCYDYFHRGHSKLNGPSTGLHHYDSQLIDLLDKLNWKTEDVHFVSYSWGCGWLAKLVNSKKLPFQSMTMIAPTYWHRHQLSSLKFIASGTIGKFLFGLLDHGFYIGKPSIIVAIEAGLNFSGSPFDPTLAVRSFCTFLLNPLPQLGNGQRNLPKLRTGKTFTEFFPLTI